MDKIQEFARDVLGDVMEKRAEEFNLPDSVAIALLEKDGKIFPYIGKDVNENNLAETFRILSFICDSEIITKKESEF